MPLYDVLRKAADRLNSGDLSNEAQVKQAVILSILRNLEWDDTDPSQFKPEYSVRNGFVDYALFTPAGPRVFVEAKRMGALDSSGETQLFSYAAHEGIPILILTDGNQWEFYLSMAAGKPPERCFLSLRISELAAQKENERHLEWVLRRASVESGSAWRFASELLDARLKRERGLKAIPVAWRRLVEEPHDTLKKLLAEKVYELSGSKPDATDVADFILGFKSTQISST